MEVKKLKRNKNKNYFKKIFIQIILVFLGYLAGIAIYGLIKGLLSFESYGIFNLFFDVLIIFIAVILGWWLWDYNDLFNSKKFKIFK